MRPTGQPSRQPSSQPTKQPIRCPTGQPSRQPTSQPSAWWGSFVGFNKFNCVPGCDPGSLLSLPSSAVANGWSSDTGGVYLLCSNCHQNWWDLHPIFGSYNGNYVYLAGGGSSPWDVRLTYTFQGVTPGSSYYVGFWQQNRDAGSLSSWTVSLGGTVVYNTLPTSNPQYIYSAIVVATSTSLTLVFEGTNSVYDYRSVYLNGVTLMQPPNGPTGQPTQQPSNQPTTQPSQRPSIFNSNPKAGIPTGQPTSLPSQQPSVQVSVCDEYT